MKSPAQGAATTVWAAIGKEWEGKGGRYLENCSEAKPGPDDGDLTGAGYVSHTYNEENEARLWADSLKIVGLTRVREDLASLLQVVNASCRKVHQYRKAPLSNDLSNDDIFDFSRP
ncbi:hypothetical protein AK830_g3519 [Neonectria ditissima]|uniref:Uncharacterized protein n=1 Tax=Neonectria ditissima TaxID=78410 RepID=A0A0P7BQ02_9HYPO|nr:hypothetical protein AK830_g3519 [Neonectria ditissima]